MIRKKLMLFTMVVYLYCGVHSINLNNSTLSTDNNKTPMIPQINVTNMKEILKTQEIDLSSAMNVCNETYQVPINYLEEMNMTGSYPDETEKLPMCFMKCLLEISGVLSSDNEIAIQQATSYFSTNDDIINNCMKEQSDIDSLDPCEYAYFLARCIMMSTLVDNRKSDT